MFVPNVHKVLTNLYHGWGKAFNRSFLGLVYQGEPAYMFDTTEHGSQSAQDPCQLDANSRALQLYQWSGIDGWYPWDGSFKQLSNLALPDQLRIPVVLAI